MGGSISRFDIELDSEQGQNETIPLVAGSVVHGQVVVEVSRAISSTSRSVQLELYGKEKVRMNRSKAKRTAGTSQSPSKVAERQFVHLTMSWPAFPSATTTATTTAAPTDCTTLTTYHSNNAAAAHTPARSTSRTIPPGTHVFPFQIQLPLSLPSSTYYPKHDNRARSKLNFRIQYKLVASIWPGSVAVVDAPPTPTTTLAPTPRPTTLPQTTVQRYLWIASTTPTPLPDPVPCMVQPIAQEITATGGWWSKGHVWFGASLANCNVVLPSVSVEHASRPTAHPVTTTAQPVTSSLSPPHPVGTLTLHVACRNDSTAPIQRVQISIVERLSWRTRPVSTVDATTGQCHTTATLHQTQLKCGTVLHHVPTTGLVKEQPTKGLLHSVVDTVFGAGAAHAVWQSPHAGTKEEQLQRQIYHDLVVGEAPIHLTVPADTRPSFTGDLIQISHYVKMEFHTGALSKTPVLEIPIQVLGAPVSATTTRHERHAPAQPSGAGDAYYIPLPSTKKTSSALVVTTTAVPTKPFVSAVTGVGAMEGHGETSSSSDTTAPSTSTTSHGEIEVEPVRRPVPYIGRKKPQVASPPTPASERPFQVTSLAHLVPLSAPTTAVNPVSVPQLMTELRASMNEFELVMDKLLEPEWVALFQSLTPEEYGTVVSGVHEFDQPRVAVVLASHVNQRCNDGHRKNGSGERNGLTCAYIAAVVRVASTNHRAVLTQKLLPLCRDAREHSHLILDELNGWEQTVTEQALQMAMR